MATLRPVNQPPETPLVGRRREEQVQEIQDWLMSPANYTVGRLGVLVARPFGVAPSSNRGAALTGLASTTFRFVLPVLAGFVVGDLAGSPVGRWAVVAGLLGLLDFAMARRMRKSDRAHMNLLALVETMEHDDDVEALRQLVKRRWRLGLNMAFATTASGIAMASFALVAPSALSELDVGSAVLLGIVAYELGEFVALYIGFLPAFLAKLARSEHRLFWLSPLDSDPVRRTLHSAGINYGLVGLAVTQYVVLSAFLVSVDSALLVPVAGTFTVIGYVAVGVAVVQTRRAARTIASRVRDRHLRALEDRIDGFGSRLGSLSPTEGDELRHLVETYRAVREMPTNPSRSETFGHAAVALVIPTLGFFLAVMSEVYAERLLDTLLP